ncbi:MULTISPECIES: hypothetical protein [unclassified Halorhabdus]|uniref:hypothetical protein n=1 Tax=unclassified Halorhabdus TaxID=2621901 RepID=UPI0012B2A1CD|nr:MULTISPECIES: hypothetical protein [unclassified Halorhabdus]
MSEEYDVTYVDEDKATPSYSFDTRDYDTDNWDVCLNDTQDSTSVDFRSSMTLRGDHTSPPVISEGSFEKITLECYFEELPGTLLGECESDFQDMYGKYVDPVVKKFEFMAHTNNESKTPLADPRPRADGSTKSESFVDEAIAIGLTIVGAFTSPPSGLALGFASFLIDQWDNGNPEDLIEVDHQTPSSEDGEERYIWTYNVDPNLGKDSFPTASDDRLGITVNVLNDNLTGNEMDVVTGTVSTTYRIPDLGGYCPCEDYGYVNHIAETENYLVYAESK